MKGRIPLSVALGAAVLAVSLSHYGRSAVTSMGPVSGDHGFPVWYQDSGGLQLELCLDPNGYCLLELPTPGSPVSFPTNFGPEAFYWNAMATASGSGIVADLTLALEAIFGGTGSIANGNQVTFARIRIRADVPQDGTYTVTHPFGSITLPGVTVANGINITQDIGNFATPTVGFDAALADGPAAGQDAVNADGRSIGPFLVAADAGGTPVPFVQIGGFQYLANPAVLTRVAGSPFGTNFFRIDGPAAISAQTEFFNLMGKVANCGPGNVAPVAVADQVFVAAGDPISIAVLTNDTDDAGLQPSSVAVSVAPAQGTAVKQTDGKILYTPPIGSVGGTRTFSYTVQDACGLVSNAATVTVIEEKLAVSSAEFKPKIGKWRIGGTSSLVHPTGVDPNILTLRMGNASGPVIGAAQVADDQSWLFTGKAKVSPGSAPHIIHITTSAGVTGTGTLVFK